MFRYILNGALNHFYQTFSVCSSDLKILLMIETEQLLISSLILLLSLVACQSQPSLIFHSSLDQTPSLPYLCLKMKHKSNRGD